MSSFLDSTGLSRLVSKITDYFAKKDGTYPDMTVGNVSNVVPIEKLPTASSVTSGDTTHVPTGNAVYTDAVQKVDGYANFYGPSDTGYKVVGRFKPPENNEDISAIIRVTYTRGSIECFTQYVQFRLARSSTNYYCSYSVFGKNIPSTFNAIEFQVHYSNNTHNAWLYAYCSYGDYFGISIQILSATKWNGVSQMDKFVGYLGTAQSESSTGITKITPTRYATPYFGGSAVGSASQPVYVDANGQVQVCSSNMQGVESVYYTNLTSNWSRIATVTITETDLVAFSADISESDTGYLSLHIEFRLRKISNVMRLSATVTNMSFASNTNNTVSVGYIANGNDYAIYLKIGTTQYTGLTGRIRLRYAQSIGWQRALFTTNVANMTGSENLTAGIVRTVSVS